MGRDWDGMGYRLPSAPLPCASWGCGVGHRCPQLPRCAAPLCLWAACSGAGPYGTPCPLPCLAMPKSCPHPEKSSELSWAPRAQGPQGRDPREGTPGQRDPKGIGMPGQRDPKAGTPGCRDPGLCMHCRPSGSRSDGDSLPPARWWLAVPVPLQHPGLAFSGAVAQRVPSF